MKAVMYHYVRPDPPDMPWFRHLRLDDFRRQLDHFRDTEGFVRREDFLAAVEAGAPVPSGVVLTFDDGFRDHWEHVLPELDRRGLWGIFYVTTGPLAGTPLDVHRVHQLLGRLGGRRVLQEATDRVHPGMIRGEWVDVFGERTYTEQDDEIATLRAKRLFNYFLPAEHRTPILAHLCETLLPAGCLDGLYLLPGQVRDLAAAEMLVGSHTVLHPVMSTLPVEAQAEEIDQSVAVLERLAGRIRTYCHPYGGEHSYTAETEFLLTKAGIRWSFDVAPRPVTHSDVATRPQALPRYDCAAFPHGRCPPFPPVA